MTTIYDEIGSEAFEQLVSHFYALVSINPVIAPMYPKDDITWRSASAQDVS